MKPSAMRLPLATLVATLTLLGRTRANGEPVALWPLTDKYGDPGADLTGNGHDGTMYGLEVSGPVFPGTDTRGYRFQGNHESYFEIPNDGLDSQSFTIVVNVMRETDAMGPLFTWDPSGKHGTQIWAATSQRLYIRPTTPEGANLRDMYAPGLSLRKWVRAVVSYSRELGVVKMCTDEQCVQRDLSTADIAISTDAVIHVGARHGVRDAYTFSGELACLAFYDSYYENIVDIDFDSINDKCFKFNDMCMLRKDEGRGDRNMKQYYFNQEVQACEPFMYKGETGNENRFQSKTACEARCAAFLPPQPKAVWPLTDKYDNPVKDITGNGHDGTMYNLAESGLYFPGTDTRAYRFAGNKDSYVEIPNNGLSPTSFTIVVYVYREDDNWSVIFAWDPEKVYGTHIWNANSQRLFVRPANGKGGLYGGAYQSGLNIRKWVRVVVSYNSDTGKVTTCTDDNCHEHNLNTGALYHRTDAIIRLGLNKGVNDNRFFKGEMACLTYYDVYFDDINTIPFNALQETCFDVNAYCKLDKDEGVGTAGLTRYFFNMEDRHCEEFTFNGNNGNGNNFASEQECMSRCSAFISTEPDGFWPLTDKYDHPEKDISGNGKHAVMHNVEPHGAPFPGTDTRGYRFAGAKDSYIEIPNDGALSPMSFTVVVYVFRENDNQAQIFAWDANGAYGTHIWAFNGQRLYFVPVRKSDRRSLTATYQSGLKVNEWVRVVLSYNAESGIVKACTNDDCTENNINSAQIEHKTEAIIRLGAHLGMNDNRVFQGEMACLVYYERYFQDIDVIPFSQLEEKCFHFNDMCALQHDIGTGDDRDTKFSFNMDTRTCTPFEYSGNGGNDNKFDSKSTCEKECSAFMAPDPKALWPLTDKHDNPVKDITGNGHDGIMYNLDASGLYVPGTDTRAYRFAGNQDSYVEIPNDGLSSESFTIVVYVQRDDDRWSVLFAWDTNRGYGTHIWSANAQRLFARPANGNGGVYGGAYQAGLNIRKWVRVVVSYNYETGKVKTCTDDDCREHNLNTAYKYHGTNAIIRLGLNKGVNDNRFFKGEMACLTYYDVYFDDTNLIPFDALRERCFDVNDFCKLDKDEGSGTKASTRYFFNMESRECEEFGFYGDKGNRNNFANKKECTSRCAAFMSSKPIGFWPLSEKFDEPNKDISGNGRNAILYNMEPHGVPFPGTGTRGYRFAGNRESYVEIPNDGSLSPMSFTVVVYLFRENDNQAQIFAWDPNGAYGTHIWAFNGQRLYFVPVRKSDRRSLTATYQSGLKVNEWVRVVLSYNAESGIVKACTNEDCSLNYINAAGVEHQTEAIIRLGVHRGINDNRFYQGKMACLTLYDQYFQDIDLIPFAQLQHQCFDFNDMCTLPKMRGSGHGSSDRFFFEMTSRKCERFEYTGLGGNGNRFNSKSECERQCAAFIPPQPKAMWPLTDKYENPVKDITGNGHDGTMFNLDQSGLYFPGTDTRAYRFAGNKDSYVEIPNNGLSPESFTIVVYVYRDDDRWSVIFAWDPDRGYGTHIWSANAQRLFARPTNANGGAYAGAYQSGLIIRQWARVVVTYSYELGKVKTCVDDDCREQNLNTASKYHKTDAIIRLGLNKGVNDNRFFKGEMACLTYYDVYFDDINLIPFEGLSEKCFDENAFCKLDKDIGTGSESLPRIFFNMETRTCENFAYRGDNGNDNRFMTIQQCRAKCSAFITPEPTALWPLTDKYENPVDDISGNGHNGNMHNIAPYGIPFPGSDTRGYRFSGNKESYVEIPNDGSLSPMSFTVVVYLFRENDNQGQIFAWDPERVYGTHLWAFNGQRLYFTPVRKSDKRSLTATYQSGLKVNEWVRVVLSYNAESGIVKACTNDDCTENFINTANVEHTTDAIIRLGVHKGINDNRFYQGEMACLAYYDRYFQDIDFIPFTKLQQRCFNFNEGCLLDKVTGTGGERLKRFHFDRESKACMPFSYTGEGGNENQFITLKDCNEKCSAFMPRGPVALWPLTDKYENPVADLTGNGHDGTMQNISPYGMYYPGTDTRGYRFRGAKDSYVEIPNDGLSPMSFTVVVYLLHENDGWGVVFAWDPQGVWGSHIWTAPSQRLFMRPSNSAGGVLTGAYQPKLHMRKWVRAVVSYNFETGFVKLCTDDNCQDHNVRTAHTYHKTEGVIRLGVTSGVNNNYLYAGQMACMAYYDQYFDDISAIDFEGLDEKCFNYNDFCEMETAEGTGNDKTKRFSFDMNARRCQEFVFKGNDGNENNFDSKTECEKKCSAFLPPEPVALWPLTDKYDNPATDVTGHGHDGTAHNLDVSGLYFPDSDTRAYRFAGNKDSYVEIPNAGLNPESFTIVVYLFREDDNWSVIFAWDPDKVYGTHIWNANSQRLFVRPANGNGGVYGGAYQSGLHIRKWVRVVVSYNYETGKVKTCLDDLCHDHNLNTALLYHRADSVIHLGLNKGVNDNRFYKGEMACMTFYDVYFEDIKQIPFDNLKNQCFNINSFCRDDIDEGKGNDPHARFYFNMESRDCEEFKFKGIGGNYNNFVDKQLCRTTCAAFIPPKPTGFWPLTEKFEDPQKDISGNGHDAVMHNMAPYGVRFPGTDTRAFRFSGSKESFVEIPNNGSLSPMSFTVVVYVFRENDNQAQLFAWDPDRLYGTHIWAFNGQRLYFVPTRKSNAASLTATYRPNFKINQWVRVVVSYNAESGIVISCVDEECHEHFINSAQIEHKTDAIIRLGVHLGINDNRVFQGEMACLTYYNQSFQDIDVIPFKNLQKECFNFNDMCHLDMDSGAGDRDLRRFYFDMTSRTCVGFQYQGQSGNANRFSSRADCEKQCAAFMPRGPVALWPLTDKYENPVADLTGNGHDGTMHNISPYGMYYPGTDTRGYRFRGAKDSYVEIPNDGLSPMSFTVVVHLLHENDGWGVVFAWDPQGVWGSHIWTAPSQRLFMRPSNSAGGVLTGAYQPQLHMRKWVRAVVSYNYETGFVKLCTDDNCQDHNVRTAHSYHKTEGVIRLGVTSGVNNNYLYTGQMACMAYYDQYFDDISAIDFKGLDEKCFNANEFCKMEKDPGSGNDKASRFFFNMAIRACEQFQFGGGGGNANNFASKAVCEKKCAAFLPPEPVAIWPLTDKFENPVADITGNGHDGNMHNMAVGYGTFPDTGTHAYRFAGQRDSYVEIPNKGLNPSDFTVVMYIKNEVNGWAQLFAWDPQGVYGTHIWVANQRLFMRPTAANGGSYREAYQPDLFLNQWIRVVVSYSAATGVVKMCNNDNCGQHNLGTAGLYHKTDAVIRLGAHLGINDNRVYKGEMACVTYYDSFFDDVDVIDYTGLVKKCFDYNGFCKLDKDEGAGSDATFRYYLDTETGKCVEFIYNGEGGNENNFETMAKCEEICHSFLKPEPLGMWPLTDRYPNPSKDITGNGHDAKMVGTQTGAEYPGTGTHGVRFAGNANSYIEIPNNGLAPQEFTYVSYLKLNNGAWGPLLAWDPEDKVGTSIWVAAGANVYFRPVSPSGTLYKDAYKNGLSSAKYSRVQVAYSGARGVVVMCVEQTCTEHILGTAGLEHNTNAVIRMGARDGQVDNRYLNADLACISLYDTFIPDLTKIDYNELEKKCFGLKRVASCTCSGDPHCLQYDKKWVHYQGSCSYTLSRDNCQDGMPMGPPSYEVINNNVRAPGHNVAYVRGGLVRLHEYDLEVQFYQGRRVSVNGKEILGSPYRVNDNVIISITPSNAYLSVKDSISVRYDGVHVLEVEITSAMIGKTCGLCGNANGNANDDWIIGPSDLCMKKYPTARPGQPTSNLDVFGSSWTAVVDSDASCQRDCPAPVPPEGCTTVSHEKAVQHCSPIKDTSGVFATCLNKMPPHRRKEYFDSCVFDSCALEIFDEIVCTFSEDIARACAEEFNTKISWRSDAFCPLDCPSGMMYKPCGSPCMPTCSDLKGEECGDLIEEPCEEGCFCKPHMVFDGKICVPKSSCGCRVPDEDVVMAVGESFINDDCSKRCSCDEAGGELDCKDISCDTNEACGIKEGVHGCHCDNPFIVADGACRPANYACTLPLDKGTGDVKVTQYWYNEVKRKCLSFDYKGDGGNMNRFTTIEECTTTCGTIQPPDECLLPKDAGTLCEDDVDGKKKKGVKMFYFNTKGKKCKKVMYKGCGGNANLFKKKKDCANTCKL